MKFVDCLCVKGDFKKSINGGFNKSSDFNNPIGNHFLIAQPDASPALQAARYDVLFLTGTDSRFVRYIMEVDEELYALVGDQWHDHDPLDF